MEVIEFYGDESCSHGAVKHLVIGGLAILQDHVPALLARLATVRARHGYAAEEVKWERTNRAKLSLHKDYAHEFFKAADEGWLNFTSLCVNKTTFDHKTYNQNDADVGFNKMIWQLLRHKVGVRFGANHRIVVKLDQRTSKDSPDTLRPMLNHDLRRDGIHTFPFKRIEFRNSKICPILQLNDLLIGALGYSLNQGAGGTSPKAELAVWITSQAHATCRPKSIYGWNATVFRVWKFSFRK